MSYLVDLPLKTMLPTLCKKYYKMDMAYLFNSQLAYVFPDFKFRVLNSGHLHSFRSDLKITQITQNEIQTIISIGHRLDVPKDWKCP